MRNLLAGKIALGLDDPLFTSGALDSLGYMRLVEYLERNFQISLSPSELRFENFDTIRKIASLVEARTRFRTGGNP